MKKWIKDNPVPAGFIILALLTSLVFGIWSASTYLQDDYVIKDKKIVPCECCSGGVDN